MAASRRTKRKRHTVAALVLDRFSMFELAVPCEVFGLDRSEIVAPRPWYDFKVCGASTTPLRSSLGFSLTTEHGLDDLVRADTVVVPAWSGTAGMDAAVVSALREAHARGARMLSLCSGAFLLAEAGLLDGRRATTHWAHAEELAQQYPAVSVDPRVLYVDEGDVLTSAGTAAGIDLCLHVVRLDYGAEAANAVARRMVVPPHREGGQAQYVELPVADVSCPDEDALGQVLAWMLEHLDEALSVEALARRAHMSPRNFARRFRAVAGTTPHQWLLAQRVLLAQRLLETTDSSVELIAGACGLGSAANLRFHFQRAVGTSPLSYRRTFRQTAFAVDPPSAAAG
jgi:transcriptional regulator GlxA family with amidase domain